MRVSRALGVGFAPAMFAAVAVAAPPEVASFSLTTVAAPECPSAEALRAEVLRLARVGTDSPRRLDAHVIVTRPAETSYRLELRTDLEGVPGERSFEGSSCQAVSDAAALTLALMMNPEVERETPVESPPAPQATAEPAPPAPASPAPLPKRTEPGPRFRGTLAAFGGFQAGVLPAAGPDLGVSFGLGLGQASLWLGVSYDPEQDVRLPGGSAGGELWAGSARLVGCWNLSRFEASIGPCAGAEISRISGMGKGVSDPDEGAIYWTSALLGLSASLAFAPSVHVYATASALLSAGRPQLFLEEIGRVHQPEAFAGRAQLGAAVDLW